MRGQLQLRLQIRIEIAVERGGGLESEAAGIGTSTGTCDEFALVEIDAADGQTQTAYSITLEKFEPAGRWDGTPGCDGLGRAFG